MNQKELIIPTWVIVVGIAAIVALSVGWTMYRQSNTIEAEPIEVVEPRAFEQEDNDETLEVLRAVQDELKELKTEREIQQQEEVIQLSEGTWNSLLPQVRSLVLKSECYSMDWIGREQARKEYVTMLDLGKSINIGYLYNKEFLVQIDYELLQVNKVLDRRVVDVTVDLEDKTVECDVMDFEYDWRLLEQAQETPR